MVPWINKGNEQKSIDFINQTDATILAGHFELEGYQVMRGVKHTDGMKPDMLQRFDKVCRVLSPKARREQRVLLWHCVSNDISDLFEKKGFHIYDTETDEIEFVPNLDKLFHAIPYNDDIDIALIDFDSIKSDTSKSSHTKRKMQRSLIGLLKNCMKNNAESVTILENETPTSEKVEVDKDALSTDTMTLISSYVDDVFSDDPEECKRLKDVFKELFLESFDV